MKRNANWSLILPPEVRAMIMSLPERVLAELEEVRVREDRPLEVIFGGSYGFVTSEGKLTDLSSGAYKPNKEDCHRLLDLMTNHSLYTMEEQLRRGFVTVAGGHRVGMSGRTVLSQGKVSHLRDIAGFNIRIAREVKGVGKPILPYLLDFGQKGVHHTLIVSPPQHGKTTLLRDLVRMISSGEWCHTDATWKAMKVGVVDERSEIAGCIKGVPSFDLGVRSDVLDGCPKAEGMMMLIRSMSPEVLVVDEFGRMEDVLAMREAIHAGVSVIATAHGQALDELVRRPGLSELLTEGVFRRIVFLQRTKKQMMFRVFDEKKRAMLIDTVRGGARV
ncbi:stage III sporulation protein AA [Paenibacillus aquistagni]|uniref:stage III sporulation protein AA n=1 Tax=Paenibacillus aquistagni TaxID=1852522 RepID=UPI00145BF78B|nr:stage III sporulation protein AA [Paenibacillus aquistagni]NMM54485.1 stage III sporulation protein AA [Paenibacillus aquistagni]